MRSTIFFVGFLIALSGLLVQTQSQNLRQKSVLDRRRENDIIDIDSPFEGSGGLQGLSSGDVDPDDEDEDEEEDDEEEEEEEDGDEFVDLDAEEDGVDEGESDVTKEEKEVAKRVPDLATDGDDDETESDGSGALLPPGSRSSSTSMASSSSMASSTTVSTASTSASTSPTPVASSTKVASSTPVARSTTRVASSTTTVSSSTVALTRCQRLRGEESSRGGSRPAIGAFRPQCTPEGEFADRQCHASTGYCWCVDREGTEILGTRARGRFDCSNGGATSKAAPSFSTAAPTLRRQPTTVRQRSSATPSPTDDIILVDNTTPLLGVKASNPTKDPTTESFIDSGVDDSLEEGVGDPSHAVQLKSRTFLSTIRDPLIFAGIIGGAVLALLCIVLLVMFTIYRMRKKDEGTYALDEPKRSASSGVKYERAQQEYFA